MTTQEVNSPPPTNQTVLPPPLPNMRAYVNKTVGISRTRLNIQAAIGLLTFGILMKITYDDLRQKRCGWGVLIALIASTAFARQAEEESITLGLIPVLIYIGAWIHANILLTRLQNSARAQFVKDHKSQIQEIQDR